MMTMFGKPLADPGFPAIGAGNGGFTAPVRGWLWAGRIFARVATFCLTRAMRRDRKQQARFHRAVAKCLREDSLTG